MSSFDEVLALGTQATIVQTQSIYREKSDECITYLEEEMQVGPAWQVLRDTLCGIQQGTAADPFSWNVELVDA